MVMLQFPLPIQLRQDRFFIGNHKKRLLMQFKMLGISIVEHKSLLFVDSFLILKAENS
nr:MAG TPA: hypothetical protein [Caudoviricetes sp.]